jgi:hypothetical protein
VKHHIDRTSLYTLTIDEGQGALVATALFEFAGIKVPPRVKAAADEILPKLPKKWRYRHV